LSVLPDVTRALLITLAVYGVAIRLSLTLADPWRDRIFALINIGAVVYIFYHLPHIIYWKAASIYLVAVCVQFFATRRFAPGNNAWIAMVLPIAFLILVKYFGFANAIPANWTHPQIAVFLGVSYLTFRLSYLAMEVHTRMVAMPSLARYIGYAFFMPIMLIGPISRYHAFEQAFKERPRFPAMRSLERIAVGLAKYFFIANLFNQLAYAGLIRNGYPHAPIDLMVAAVSYYLFLYANFSGFCDMVIGFCGLLGIPVEENFNNPLIARNLQDFWKRWHMTLSTYMRDMVFNPLSKTLALRLGSKNTDHAIALTIFVVFMLIGMWHGVGLNFFWFGVAHGTGVVINQYYTLWLKRHLTKEQFKAYNANKIIRAMAILVTFMYVAATCLLFANDMDQIRSLRGIIQW
jgi:D-alanyl-lipoteichoic acid acyltransferase DltB (MBOAT superfamily)